jgi:hypothetical protein
MTAPRPDVALDFGERTIGEDVDHGCPVTRQGYDAGSRAATRRGGRAIYWSHQRDGLDAVQMEFGAAYVRKDVVARSARDAARAIAAFYEAYLRPRDAAR